jgi:KDO2-lipid IV(A) lauroyltransferase
LASRTLRAFRSRLLYRALLAVGFIGRRIPLSVGRQLGRILGWLAFQVARRERKKALQNVAIAFPEWSVDQCRRTIRGMFRHLGETLFETVWLPNLDAETCARTTIIEAAQPVLDIIASGQAVIAFTGHCGNWEWLAAAVAGLGAPVTVLQRERDDPGMNRFITNIRAHAGIRTADRGSSASGRELIQAARRPGMLAFLIDQNIRAESAKVPFFGRPALTPIGPAKLAIRMENPVVPAFIERRPDGMQVIRFQEPILTRRADDAIALTARITAAIEAQIRRVPEQWVWMHDRWRERPQWDVDAAP